MSKTNTLKFNSPGLFVPSVIRGITDSSAPTGLLDFSTVEQRNIGTTSSFRYDPPGVGLRSTQQIELDWDKFENHTFFQSARTNVNLAFYKIINSFPFDGTQKEIEEFLDSLTGFEKYVYNRFPKNKGYLFFSGSNDANSGTFVVVPDFAGANYPTISKNKTGDSVLNPGLSSLSWEMQLFLASGTNDVQTVAQKLSGSLNGISLFVSQSTSPNNANIIFSAISGSSNLLTSASITKGIFNHVVATFNRKPGLNRLELYINEELRSTSSINIEFGDIDFNVSPFIIGSGSSIGVASTLITPIQTLSGALDEFRFFHDVRTIEQQKEFAKKNIFTDDDLVLYYKFNEPSGSIASSNDDETNRVVLDYSGKSLHGLINSNGFSLTIRETGSVENPLLYESQYYSPVLFPNYQNLIDLNSEFLTSASIYDVSNPNLITKLIPAHYFWEGQAEEGLLSEDGTIVDELTGISIPGTATEGQSQIIQTLLFVWAKFFDELKIYLDNFGKTLHVSYDGKNSAADQLLPKIAEEYGITLPSLFGGSSIDQFIDSQNFGVDFSLNQLSLKDIQNKIWRRILINIQDIIQSKGTIHSIKSFIRTIGIDPDSNFRIREYGGPTKRNISNQRETKTEVSAMLDMSGTTSLISSQILTASRIERGFPTAVGSFVLPQNFPPHGISNYINDGLLTSGSWTVEGIYKFTKGLEYSLTQSLARINSTTGSNTTTIFAGGSQGVLANLVAISSSLDISSCSIKLFVRPSFSSGSAANLLTMALTGVNVFDGNKWNVSFGRFRNDDPSDYLEDINLVKSSISSSYFLRAARSLYGNINEIFTTQSFYMSSNTSGRDIFELTQSTTSASGTILAIGSQSISEGNSANYFFLNNNLDVPDNAARSVDFDGKVSQLRFWSKGLLLDEWKEHVKNFKNVGVSTPLTNFNFDRTASGSWGRLRLDVSMDQILTQSNGSGLLELFDFSQNNFHMSGTGFEASTEIIKPETFYYSFISPKFDEAATTNKVRVRGYQNERLAMEKNASFGVVNSIPLNEEPQDDPRFTIDFGIIDYLNQDIVNIFSTLEELDNLIGAPEISYSPDYPGLERLRFIYFRRLNSKINLKSFFEFFKWFDSTIGNFIYSLLPRKTKFKGINFIIESHMLERPKFENLNINGYLNNNEKEFSSDKGQTIILEGLAKKY